MDAPVYRLFFDRPTPLASGLGEAERDQAQAQARDLAQAVGMKQLLVADTDWSSGRHERFGVELYPSLKALQDYTHARRATRLPQYADCESFLGIPLDGTANQLTPIEPPCEGDTPVYRVYLSRLTAKGYTLSTDELNQVNGNANEAARMEGSQPILSAYCRWNNEEWEYFGVERFPCMEALLRYSQFLSASNWYSIWQSRSCLGTAVSGSAI